MRTVRVGAIAVAIFSSTSCFAATASAYEAGLKVAGRHGHSGQAAQCYAKVFAEFATPRPKGGWRVGGKTAHMSIYKGTLRSKCGVSR